MSTLELKNLLIQRISGIQDRSFLEAIKTILDSNAESKVINLTSEMTKEIIASQKEIELGIFIENNLLEKEVSSALSKKGGLTNYCQ